MEIRATALLDLLSLMYRLCQRSNSICVYPSADQEDSQRGSSAGYARKNESMVVAHPRCG